MVPVISNSNSDGLGDGSSQNGGEETAHRLQDDRGAAHGLGRLIVAAFWVAGVLTVGAAIWELFSEHTLPIGPKLNTLFAGLIYLAAALGLTHNGRRMRMVAWTATSVALGGPIIMGLAGLGSSAQGSLWSPWVHFGQETWFVSLVLPIIGLAWLWWSNPRRIVEIAEGIERTSRRMQPK